MKHLIIERLLAEKHAEDLLIPQCKTGPTNEGVLQLDYWAMKKSWSRPNSIGYEVKISRSDFLRDQKWMKYLPYCNEFYWVAPKGIIQLNEVTPECGYIELTTGGARLLTKKKAQWRDVSIPEDFYRYILMARTKITSTYGYRPDEDKFEFWRMWLENKDASLDIGHKVSKKIRRMIKEKIMEVETKQKLLEKQNADLNSIKELCEKMGVDINGYWIQGLFERKLKELTEIKTNLAPVVGHVEELKKSLDRFLKNAGALDR